MPELEPRPDPGDAGRQAFGLSDAQFFASIAAGHTGRSVAEELSAIERASSARAPSRTLLSAQVGAPPLEPPITRADLLAAARVRIEQKFQGKLEPASALLARTQGSSRAPALDEPAKSSSFSNVLDAICVASSEQGVSRASGDSAAHGARPLGQTFLRANHGRARRSVNPVAEPGLSRNQRRVLVKHAARQLTMIAKRFVSAAEERGGVWSREDYRRIRAAVQDASGRAACCILYQLGSREAVTLASELDPRVPMDRRKIAFAYAVARAPGSDLGERLKLGFAMGLWSSVLADPNNPNMERRRRFRPSRRTLSSDLSWLEERKVLKRWQVKMEHAAPCERKQNPNYPTNRYFAPMHRDGGSMMSIARALGDVPPPVLPNPSEAWSEEDALALAQAREVLMRELGVLPLPRPPD